MSTHTRLLKPGTKYLVSGRSKNWAMWSYDLNKFRSFVASGLFTCTRRFGRDPPAPTAWESSCARSLRPTKLKLGVTNNILALPQPKNGPDVHLGYFGPDFCPALFIIFCGSDRDWQHLSKKGNDPYSSLERGWMQLCNKNFRDIYDGIAGYGPMKLSFHSLRHNVSLILKRSFTNGNPL